MAATEERSVTMTSEASAAAERHCFSRIDVEVGGFLLGSVDDTEVRVAAIKPALAATSAQTHLTFTHEAWAEVLEVMDTEFPGLVIVGWYHSHPGFGCFLSDYDVFIQQNFFSGEGQHALVIDPVAGRWGRFVVREAVSVETASGPTRLPAIDAGGDKVSAIARARTRTRTRRAWPRVLLGALAASLVVGGLAWFAGNVQGRDAARASTDDRVAAAQGEIAELQAALAEASVAAQEQALASPADEPPPEPSPEPSPQAPEQPSVEPVEGDKEALLVGQDGVFVVTHTVQPGDSLWALADRYLGDGSLYRRVLRENPEVRESGLEPGQQIRILVRGTLAETE